MRKTRLCLFHERGYCERGPECSFAHGEHELWKGGGRGGRTDAARVSGGRGHAEPAADASFANRGGAAGGGRGVCKFFQETGQCRNGSSCRFSHETGRESHPPATSRDAWEEENASPGGKVVEGKNAERPARVGTGGGGVSIHTYLSSEAPFSTPQQVRRFVDAAAAFEDQGILPSLLGKEAGLIRISEICSWDFSCSAGGSMEKLSFQRVVVPFLKVVTQEAFRSSILSGFVDPLYSTMHKTRAFETKVMNCLLEVTEVFDIKDRNLSRAAQDDGVWEPRSWVQIFEPVALYFEQVLLRLPDTQSDREIFEALHEANSLFKVWSQQDMRRGAEGICLSLESSMRMLEAAAERRRENGDRQVLVDGPGELSARCRPRHDNDRASIESIAVAPTSEEALSSDEPFLPSNTPGAPHHLKDGVDRHLDTHFRLLREDFMRSLRTNLSQYAARGEGCVRDGVFACGSSDVMFVYSNVVVLGISCDQNQGVSYVIEFDELPRTESKDLPSKRKFWEQTKRLQHGCLVCFWWDRDQGPDLVFATVSQRDTEQLVRKDGGRPRIGVSLSCGSEAVSEKLSATSTGAVLLQVCDSFFSYYPVLKSLQANKVFAASSPLSRYISSGARVKQRAKGAVLSVSVETGDKDGGIISRGTSVIILGESKEKRGHTLVRAGGRKIYVPSKFLISADVPLAPAYVTSTTRYDLLSLVQNSQGKDDSHRFLCNIGSAIPEPWKVAMEYSESAGNIAKGETVVLVRDSRAVFGFVDEAYRDEGGKWGYVVRVSPDSDALEDYDVGPECVFKICIPTETQHRINMSRVELMDPEKREAAWKVLRQYSTMDEAQLTALEAALTKEISLIQGPPGTGKSYMGILIVQTLVKNALRGLACIPGPFTHTENVAAFGVNIGPVLVLCYTNHQLDQHLEGLLAAGVDKVVRVGSRSKSVVLQKRNIRELAKAAGKDKGVSALMYECHSNLKECADRISEAHALLDTPNLQAGRGAIELLGKLVDSYEKEKKRLQELRDHLDLRIMRQNDVIGMTTTGASGMRDLLKALGPRVIIVEEAAEVLEAHVLAALSPQTSQLVFIGDHKQLRPKTAVYDLTVESGKGKNLDLSMFERLVHSDTIGHCVLTTQRRMQPAISQLIRSTIYPELIDHPHVSSYPRVRGMQKSLYFFDHDHREDGADDEESRSKSNVFEVQMVVGFAAYMLRQGYGPGEITVLTPYAGQLLKLREALSRHTQVFLGPRDREDLRGMGEDGVALDDEDDRQDAEAKQGCVRERVRLATIDNFQGEESEVVIISLVRNNPAGRIGFLKTSNRINVLLSRAKHGLYLFGHAASLTKDPSSKVWPAVLGMLKDGGGFGTRLPLCCQKHPDTCTEIDRPEQIGDLVGDGGCSRACGAGRACGHTCARRCHPGPCGDCAVVVGPVTLPCGHVREDARCCDAADPRRVACRVAIEVRLLACGHALRVACAQREAALKDQARCGHVCGRALPCGHKCAHRCGSAGSAPGAGGGGGCHRHGACSEEGCARGAPADLEASLLALREMYAALGRKGAACGASDLQGAEERYGEALRAAERLLAEVEAGGDRGAARAARMGAARLALCRARGVLEWALGGGALGDAALRSVLGDGEGVGRALALCGPAGACGPEGLALHVECAAAYNAALVLAWRRARAPEEAHGETQELFDRAFGLVYDAAAKAGDEEVYEAALRGGVRLLACRAAGLWGVRGLERERVDLLKEARGVLGRLGAVEREGAEAEIEAAARGETCNDVLLGAPTTAP